MSNGFFLEEYVPYTRCIRRQPAEPAAANPPEPASAPAPDQTAAPSAPPSGSVDPAAEAQLLTSLADKNGHVDVQKVVSGVVNRLLDFFELTLKPYPDILALFREQYDAEFLASPGAA